MPSLCTAGGGVACAGATTPTGTTALLIPFSKRPSRLVKEWTTPLDLEVSVYPRIVDCQRYPRTPSRYSPIRT